jgi:hypothetical protein
MRFASAIAACAILAAWSSVTGVPKGGAGGGAGAAACCWACSAVPANSAAQTVSDVTSERRMAVSCSG